MSIQVLGTGFETGLDNAAVRLANEAQLNGFSGAAGPVFNDSLFQGGTHNEILSNWIASLGDKNLRVSILAGLWKLSVQTKDHDVGTHGYTLAKVLPKPEERVPALPAAPNSGDHQGVFLGDVVENGFLGGTNPPCPLFYIQPAGVDGSEFNYALFQTALRLLGDIVRDEIASFAFRFSDDTMLSIQQLQDAGWVGNITKNRNGLLTGPEIDRYRTFALSAPATGVEYGLIQNGAGYGISLGINGAGGAYGLAVLGGSLNGGSGDYAPTGTTQLNVPVTGGDGVDLTVDIDIDGGGIVTSVTINNSGNGGYKSGNILTIDNSGGGGGTSADFEVLVTGNLRTGSPHFQSNRRDPFIDSIIAAGDTYTPNTQFTDQSITPTTNSLGYSNDTDAVLTRVSFTTDISGVIIPSTLVFNRASGAPRGTVAGTGFKTGDRFTVNGSGGTPLEFEIKVKNINYNTVATTGAGTGLTVDIIYDVNGAITDVFPVEPGSGYVTGDTVEIENVNGDGAGSCELQVTAGLAGLATTTTGAGTGMTVDVLADTDGQVFEVLVNDPGSGYLNGDIVTITGGNGQAEFGIFFIAANTEFQNPNSWDRHFVKIWRDGADYKIKFTDRNKNVIFVEGSGLPIAANARLLETHFFGGPAGSFDDYNIWNTEAGDAAQWTTDQLNDDFEFHRKWMFTGNILGPAKLTDGTGYATEDGLAVTQSSSSGTGMLVDIIVVGGVITFIRIQDQGKDYDFDADTFTIVQGGGSGGTFKLQGNITKSLGDGADWDLIDTWIDTGSEFNDANFDDTHDGRKNTFAKSTTDRFGMALLKSFEQQCADVGYTIQSVEGFSTLAWRISDPEAALLRHLVQAPDATEIFVEDSGAVGEEGVIHGQFLRGETGFDSINPQPTDFGYNFLMKRP